MKYYNLFIFIFYFNILNVKYKSVINVIVIPVMANPYFQLQLSSLKYHRINQKSF